MERVKSIPPEKIKPFLEKALEAGEKYYIMLILGLSTGLRISDILKIKVCQVTRKKCFCITEKKTGKTRTLILDEQVKELIKRYIKSNNLTGKDYLVYSNNKCKSRSLSRSQAYNVTRKAAASVGLVHVSPHSLRKTYAKLKYQQSHSLEAVQENLNHDYFSTTLLYLIDDFSNIKL